MTEQQEEFNSSQVWQGRSALMVMVAILSFLWCIVLPWIAAQPRMKQQLDFLDDRGIDPSAMFYTELDAMDGILKKTNVQ